MPSTNSIPKILVLAFMIATVILMIYRLNTYSINLQQRKQTKIRMLTQQKNKSQRIKQFQKYFDSVATVVKASTTLRNETEYSPITWHDFGNQLPMVDMTAVFLTSGRYDYLEITLQSFFQYNTYPITKLVIGNDGPDSPKLKSIRQKYTNMTWVITNINVGQLETLDQIYKYIDTDYFFFSEDDFQYFRPGFIEYSLQAQFYDPKLVVIFMAKSNFDKGHYLSVGPLKLITTANSLNYSGFTFWPSTRRLSDYKKFQYGYNDATFNVSYGKGAGRTQTFISKLYTYMGYHIARSPIQFYNHIGIKSFQHKYQIDTKVINKDVQKLNDQFEEWYANNSDIQEVKKSVAYLFQLQRYPNLTRCTRVSDFEVKNNQTEQNKNMIKQLVQHIQKMSKKLNTFEQFWKSQKIKMETLEKQNEDLKASLSQLQQINSEATSMKQKLGIPIQNLPNKIKEDQQQKQRLLEQNKSLSDAYRIIVYVSIILGLIIVVLIGVIVKLSLSQKPVYQSLRREKSQENKKILFNSDSFS